MSENKKEVSPKKKVSFAKNVQIICSSHIFKQIDKNISICEHCGIITYTEKVMRNTFTKTLIKPKNYYKSIDISPFQLLENLNKHKEIKLYYPSFFLNFRTKLINILYNLNKKFSGSLTTLYLSISYLDRIFCNYYHIENKLGKKITLLTISSYIIAYKYYEIDHFLNHIDFSYLMNKFNVTRDEILKYEVKCLQILEYNLNEVDIFSILKVLMYSGFVFQNEELNISLSKLYRRIITFFDDILLEDRILKNFSNKQIAFSIIYYIRKKYGFHSKVFKEEITKKLYNYEYENYEKCVNYFYKIFNDDSEIEKNLEQIPERAKSYNKLTEIEKNDQNLIKEYEKRESVQYINRTERNRRNRKKVIFKLSSNSISPDSLKIFQENATNNHILMKRNSHLLKPIIGNSLSLKTKDSEVNKDDIEESLENKINLLKSKKNLNNIRELIKIQKNKFRDKNLEDNNQREDEKNENYFHSNLNSKRGLKMRHPSAGILLQIEKLQLNELKNQLINSDNSSKDISLEKSNKNNFKYISSNDNSEDLTNKLIKYNEISSRNYNRYNSCLYNKSSNINKTETKRLSKSNKFILTKKDKKDRVIFPYIGN